MRRSKREHVARNRSPGITYAGNGKTGISEKQCKVPPIEEVEKVHITKTTDPVVDGDQNNFSTSKRLDARRYRQSMSAKFKVIIKEPQEGESTKNQVSDASTPIDGSAISNKNRQMGEHVTPQLVSLDNDGRLQDLEQNTESGLGVSGQDGADNSLTVFEKSSEQREFTRINRKQKHQAELQQDYVATTTAVKSPAKAVGAHDQTSGHNITELEGLEDRDEVENGQHKKEQVRRSSRIHNKKDIQQDLVKESYSASERRSGKMYKFKVLEDTNGTSTDDDVQTGGFTDAVKDHEINLTGLKVSRKGQHDVVHNQVKGCIQHITSSQEGGLREFHEETSGEKSYKKKRKRSIYKKRDVDRDMKEGNLLDDSGMDLVVSVPIGDKGEMQQHGMSGDQHTRDWAQCINCKKWKRIENIQVCRESWCCDDSACHALNATCAASQEETKQGLSDSCMHIEPNTNADDHVESLACFQRNESSANICGNVGVGQESANGDSESDENNISNDSESKTIVWAEIEKGRWWPAFTVLKSDSMQKKNLSTHDGLALIQLIYSVDSREEPEFIEARSFRPFWENYEELKNMCKDKKFLDAVTKAHQLYHNCLPKDPPIRSVGLQRSYLESSGQVEEPFSSLQEDKAIVNSDKDGGDDSAVTQKRAKRLSKNAPGFDTRQICLEECEDEDTLDLKSIVGGTEISREDANIEEPSSVHISGSVVKSSTDCYNNVCQVCKEGGELLCCDGKDCLVTYHIGCLDPPLAQVPPGDWYCPTCTYKRISCGVRSVCKGVESIWDVKHVEPEQFAELDVFMEKEEKVNNIFESEYGVHPVIGCSMSVSTQRDHDGLKEKTLLKSNNAGDLEITVKTAYQVKSDKVVGRLKKKQRIYFVKYKGLSHLHNCWVSEILLVKESPKQLANFKKKLQQGKALKWNSEWAEPQRLIQRRALIFPKHPDKECRDTVSELVCQEWFVKWKGLGYDQCTWELEDTSFLNLTSTKELMKAYKLRYDEAHQRASPTQAVKAKSLRNSPFSRLKRPPDWMKGLLDSSLLRSVNKLREFWQNHRNAFVIDEVNQERIAIMIAFTLSLIKDFHINRPILIITSTAGIYCWESEFLRWASSVNMVAYCGNRESRDIIRKLEFSEESGCVLVQIVLSTSEAVTADLDSLICLDWEAVIVDEGQRLKLSKVFQHLEQLPADFRLVLFHEQLKDNASDVSHLLAFLDSEKESEHVDEFEEKQHDSSEHLGLLKSKLSEYIVYERKSDPLTSANFKEYWVPVDLANVQVEQYCNIVMTNIDSLSSVAKKNDSGALRDILLSLRKCCNHPYLVDGSLQSLQRKGLSEVEFLDADINASSKLQLLDNILSELRLEGQRVLILFQMIGRSGRTSIGDILDDHIRQRFGVDSYERIDGGLPATKKQAALQKFNSKDSGRFVFLLEKRACGTSIKLFSIDTVIIFDSDWNPISDIRALQKIHIDNQVEYLKVFRFYCPYTVEERVLIYAKQDYLLDNSLENFSATVCHLLLRWGVAHLFEKYEKLHDVNDLDFKLTSVSRNENLKSLSQDMLARARDIAEIDNTPENGIIAKVPWEGRYGKGVPLLGESDSQLTAEKIPTNIFWTKLLKGRCIKNHGTTGQMQRPRRKVQYYEGSPTKSVSDSDDVEAKKKRRRVCGTLDPISISSWLKDAKKSLASEKEITENNIHLNADGAKQTSNESVKDDCGKFSHPMFKKSITDMLYGKHPSPCSGSCDADTEVAGSDCETINGKSYRETPDGGYKRSLSAAEDAFIIKEHGHSLPHGFLSAPTSHGQELSGSGAAYDSANPEGFISRNTETEDGNALHVAEQSLHNRIKPDLVKLCKMLQLPEAVKRMAEEFLSYVTNDYFLPKETTSFVQAVEISLCWAAAESLKYNIDLEKSLELANVHLNFECKRVEVDSVYLKLREQCLKLSRDIPHSTEQSGSGINITPGYSASQQHDDEMFLQDDRVSTSRSNDNIKSSMQTTSIQEPISTHNSSRLDDDQQVRLDTTQNTERREMDSQYQTGLIMSEQENSEAIGTGNTQDVEKNLNPHPKQYLVDQATNQVNVILLDEVGVSNSPSSPGVDILSECQWETLSPGKVKWLKEKIQVRKHARLRQQQAEVAEFFTHRDNERKRLQASQSMECNGIRNTYSDPEIRNAKLREKNLLHVQVAAQLEERLKKELEDLKKKQADIREKENRTFSMCLEHINSGKISRYHSDIIESGSIPEDLESVLQSNTGEACDPVGIILPSPTETERLILASTSEQQANAPPSESLIICPENQVSSELLGDQQNQQVDEQTACHMSNLPPTEMDNFHSTSRSRPSLERSRSRLRMLGPYQSDQVRPSPDSQQLHPNQHSFLQPDISPLSVGTGEQYNQDCDDRHVIQTQELNGTQRPQQERLDNTSVCSPSSVPMMPIESSQPPQVIDMSERLSATTETSMFLNGLTRGNEPFQVSQFVASNNAQIHITAPSRSVQTNVPDPLYHEMLRIRKEQERIRKLHEEENTRIRVQFEKELEELKRRYTTLLQEEDYTFAQKKRILETNFIKVDMNRRLAEAFKIKVHDNNFTVPLVQSGSATQLQQPRQQALPASSVRLSQLATPLVHTVPAMIPPEISTSCSLPPVSGEQAGGMLSLHSNTQSDARSLGLARRINHCMTLQNTQLGQPAQGISSPHNVAVPDISSRNIQPSGCPGSIALGGVAAETRMQAQGNTGEIISNAHLPDMNSVTSQRLQQHEISHFLSSPNRSSSSGSLISSCNPLNQSQGNHLLYNTFSLANAQRANLPTVSACGVVEVGTQAIADITVGNLQSPFPLALGACLGGTPGMPQLSSSNLQQTNSSSIVENFISTEVQQATQEGVLLENNGEVGASFVYGNNASNPPVLTTETASVAPELEVSHSPLLVPAQSNCNTMTHCSSTPSVIYLSDDD